MTLTREQPELERPIGGIDDLVDYFRAAEKPRDAWLVGTEYEKLGLYQDTLEPVTYEGPRGLRVLFEKLAAVHGFAPILQGELIVGLEQGASRITLEPGGALELGGAPLASVHESCGEFAEHLALLKQAGAEFGIAWLALGAHPFARLEQTPRMPSERHGIMRKLLAGTGRYGLHMMHMTAGVQVNIDFASERDVARKMRVAAAASPIATAFYANSSLSEGRPNGYASFRAEIWRDTDASRCMFPEAFFADEWLEGSAYRAYTQWALDVPMWFIRRDGRHVEMPRRSFRDYLARSSDDAPALLADWALHLTTLFPEVRLKRVIEIRDHDAVQAGLVCGLPAFWKGLLYDETSLDAALARLRRWTHADVDALQADAARRGLAAKTPDGSALDVARELLALSRAGLERIARRRPGGRDETAYLDSLEEVAARGTSPGTDLVARWERGLDRDPRRLIEYVRY
jgi:glutamate--cysteine ligase